MLRPHVESHGVSEPPSTHLALLGEWRGLLLVSLTPSLIQLVGTGWGTAVNISRVGGSCSSSKYFSSNLMKSV